MDAKLAATGERCHRLGAAGPGGLPHRAAHRRAGRRGERESTPPQSSASPPTSPPARCCPRPPTAPALPAARMAGRRTATQALETPRRQPAGGPDQRAGHKRSEPWIARYGGKISRVAVRQGASVAGRRSRDLRPRAALDRGRRLDHLATVRHRDTERLHGRLQGHMAGRALSGPQISCRLDRGSPTSPRQAGASIPASGAARVKGGQEIAVRIVPVLPYAL